MSTFKPSKGLAEQHLWLDPFGGALFVFTNKTRDRIKLLHWDGSRRRIEQVD